MSELLTVENLKEAFPKEGFFYIGDPCYVFTRSNYDRMLDEFWEIPPTEKELSIAMDRHKKEFNLIKSEIYKEFASEYKLNPYLMDIFGHKFILSRTNYGDGCYPVFEFGEDNHCLESDFDVDSGLYCIIPSDSPLLDKRKIKGKEKYKLEFSNLLSITTVDRGHLILAFKNREIIINTT